MSYRLVDSNALAIKYPEVNDKNCIYADLEDGLDNKYHTVDDNTETKDKLSKAIKEMQLVIDDIEYISNNTSSNDPTWINGFDCGLNAAIRVLTERIESVHNVI